MTKYCSGCEKDLPLDRFGKDKHRGDGLTIRCKICRNAWNRAYVSKHSTAKDMSWSLSDRLYLKENYPSNPTRELTDTLKRSENTINEYARRKGLSKNYKTRAKNNMEKLLNGSLESYYWLGLIAADGYISKEGHLMVSLKSSDKKYLQSFANFIDTKINIIKCSTSYVENYEICRVSAQKDDIGLKIRDMFGTIDRKTYEEIKIDWIKTDDAFLSFLIGFIDGDGSIGGNGCIRIENHINMKPTFEKIRERLYNILGDYGTLGTSKRGYALFSINKQKLTHQLKNFTNNNKLPVLRRKWDKIQEIGL